MLPALWLAALAPAANAQVQGGMANVCLDKDIDVRKEIEKLEPMPLKSETCPFPTHADLSNYAEMKAKLVCEDKCKDACKDTCKPVLMVPGAPAPDPAACPKCVIKCMTDCMPGERLSAEKGGLNACLAVLQHRYEMVESVLRSARSTARDESSRVDVSNLSDPSEKLAYYRQGNVLCNAAFAMVPMGKEEGLGKLAPDEINALSAPGGGAQAFEYMQRFERGLWDIKVMVDGNMDERARKRWGWKATGDPPPQGDGRDTFFKRLTDADITSEVGGVGGGKKTDTSLAAIPGFKARDCRYLDCSDASGTAGGSGATAGPASPSASGPAREPGSASGETRGWSWVNAIPGRPAESPADGGGGPSEQARGLLEQADAALTMREWKDALDYLTKALELEPGNTEARVRRSVLYNIIKRYLEAEQDARAALELDPKNARAWASLAWALLRQGRYREAVMAASSAIGLAPESAFAYRIRAEARERLGDEAGKLEDLAKAAALDARFQALNEAVSGGQRIQDDDSDPVSLFLEAGVAPRRPSPAPLAALGAAAALVVLAGLWVWRARSRRPAGLGHLVPGGPAPPAAPAAATAVAAVPPPAARLSVGKYKLERPLGTGGRLFMAVEPASGRALVLRRTAVPQEQLREGARVAQAWNELAHPALVRVLDLVAEGPELWLALEFVEGEPLEQWLDRQGRLTLEQAAARLGPPCHAVEAAHEKGLFHGDLRPSRLLVSKEGRSMLTGFLLPGEPGAAEASVQSDIAMLGACLSRMLTGVSAPPSPAECSSLGREAQALVAKALHPDPAQRFKTAGELSKALRAAADAPTTPSRVSFEG